MRKLFRNLNSFGKLIFIKILPIHKKRYVFSSFNGHYSDSPKKISEQIHNLDNDIEIVWLIDKKYKDNVPKYVIKVDINSIKALFYRGTAKVLIDNVYADKAATLTSIKFIDKVKYKIIVKLQQKKKQNVYTTWHGTPLKRMGRDQIGNTEIDFNCPNTTMILENEYTKEIMEHLTFNKIKVLLMGCPRNDVLININDFEKLKIKKKLQIPENKKVILFAPTFRSDGNGMDNKNIYRSGIEQLNQMDFEKLFEILEKKFGGEWVFVCRFHYFVEKLVDWNNLEQKYGKRIINGNLHDDMSDYLVSTDILVTDASSCMFDYSLTLKPCFLLFPDLDYYKNQERGFYYNIEELPFPLANTFDELLENINVFNTEKYMQSIDRMHSEFGYVKNANSSKQIVNYILNENK